MMSAKTLKVAAFVLRAISLLCFLVALERPAKADPITALAGSAAISAGGSLLGGIFGSSAASKAAKAQQDAARQAGQGVIDTTSAVRQGQIDTARAAGQRVTDTADQARTDVNSTANQGAFNVTDAATGANRLLDPYAGAGSDASDTLRTGLAPGGDFNKTPTLADLQIDPGYDFRLQQGEKALAATAAARGGVMGGGFAKDIANFGQQAGSQEYQNAFNRFRQSTQDRFSNLNTVAQRGVGAASEQGQNMNTAARFGAGITTDASKFGGSLATGAQEFSGNADIGAVDRTSQQAIDAAKAKGEYLTQGANAKAAGIVGGANSITSGLAGVGNAATGAASLYSLLKNPATIYNRISYDPFPGDRTDHSVAGVEPPGGWVFGR